MERFDLDVQLLASTDSVKAKFHIREARPPDQRGPIFVGRHGCNFHRDSALDLALRARGGTQIFVVTLTSKSLQDGEAEGLCNQACTACIGMSMSCVKMEGDSLDENSAFVLQHDEVDSPCNQQCNSMDQTTEDYTTSKSFGKMEGEAFDKNLGFVLRDEADEADDLCNQECEGEKHSTGIDSDIMSCGRMEGDAVKAGRFITLI